MKHPESAEIHGKGRVSEFSLAVRVYYQDTDAGGVVYHSRYLDFMERARYEWLRGFGFSNRELASAHRVMFVVRSASIAYLKPALLDDWVQVTALATELGRSRVALAQRVLRGAEVLARAKIELACVGCDDLKPASIPGPVREKLKLGEP